MAINAPERLTPTHGRSQIPEQVTAVDIETLVHTYYDPVHRLALAIIEDPDEAEDATQETFIAAARALAKYRGEASLKTWLFAIAVNECRQLLRKRSRRQKLLAALPKVQHLLTDPLSPEENVTRAEDQSRLHTAVNELKEKHRLPVLLRYLHNMKAAEIAGILNISEGTVHSRLHYARAYLRQKLEDPK